MCLLYRVESSILQEMKINSRKFNGNVRCEEHSGICVKGWRFESSDSNGLSNFSCRFLISLSSQLRSLDMCKLAISSSYIHIFIYLSILDMKGYEMNYKRLLKNPFG